MFFAFRIIAGWLQVEHGLSAGIIEFCVDVVIFVSDSFDNSSARFLQLGLGCRMLYCCLDRLCCFDSSIGNEMDRNHILSSWDGGRSEPCTGSTVVGCRDRADRSFHCFHVVFGLFVGKQRVAIIV